jgi:hypothetical protein
MTRFWNIEYEGDLLDKDGPARRAVRTYQAMKGITQPQAVAEMLLGYAQLVGLPTQASLNGSPPHGTTGGSNQGSSETLRESQEL